jgi:hypothetical protein
MITVMILVALGGVRYQHGGINKEYNEYVVGKFGKETKNVSVTHSKTSYEFDVSHCVYTMSIACIG